jgi:SNF2 family DNA or RNA helicase
MQPCIRHTRAEVLEHLPPVTVSGRHAELTSLQLKAYNEMRRWLAASFGDGQVAEATQKAALLSKLFQICLGQVLTSDGGTVMIDNRYRVALIDELIRGTERKAVIFCAYRAALADLERSLKRLGHDVALVDGGVSGTRRDEIFSSFQRPDGPRVLVAHPVTTAYGTELAAADLLILNGPMMSGVHSYMQGLARLSSAKQSAGRISVIELSSSPEEREFFASLRRRTSFAQATGDLFGRIVRKEI